jgi:hypothetical protein
MDELFAKDLESINWLACCGEPLHLSLPFPTASVSSWSEAMRCCSAPSWEDVALEAQNRLTLHLHIRRLDDYRRWNAIVQSAKERVVLPLAERVWSPLAERLGFEKVLVDCISWDVLGAIMEHEYNQPSGLPRFFLDILQVYRAGHFPCGWTGHWPRGTLLVW